MKQGQKARSEQSDLARKAGHLRDAIVRRAGERGDSPADVARIMDMSMGHWYRIKKEPGRLARLPLERLNTIATYVGWPRVQVMIAVGWLQPAEVDQLFSADAVVKDALRRLDTGTVANGLATPLERAAPDHRLLMARLLLLAEAGVAGASEVRASSMIE